MFIKGLVVVLIVFVVGVVSGIGVQKKFFESDSRKVSSAIQILDSVPEIKKLTHQPGIIIVPDSQTNKIVLDLRDNTNADFASRVDTFEVNLDTKQIKVYDVLSDSMVPLSGWLKAKQK